MYITIKEALFLAVTAFKKSRITTYHLDSEVLLGFVLGVERSYLYAHSEKQLTTKQYMSFQKLLRKRARRVPIAYLTNHKEFFGLDFVVSSAVLIPRPDTEILVERVSDYVATHPTIQKILDIGTGSGCIAIALAKKYPLVRCDSTDTSRAALEIAKKNIRIHNVSTQIRLVCASLYPARSKYYEVIVSNPPYLSAKEYTTARIKYPELNHEPRRALVASKNGLALLTEIIKTCSSHLTEKGVLFLEIGSAQRRQITSIVKKYLPKASLTFHKDLAGKTRVAQIQLQ